MKGKIFAWSSVLIMVVLFTTIGFSRQSNSEKGFFDLFIHLTDLEKPDPFLSLLVGVWENSNVDDPKSRLVSKIEIVGDEREKDRRCSKYRNLLVILYLNTENQIFDVFEMDSPLKRYAIPFRIFLEENKARKFSIDFNTKKFIFEVDGLKQMHALNIDLKFFFKKRRTTSRNISLREEFYKRAQNDTTPGAVF